MITRLEHSTNLEAVMLQEEKGVIFKLPVIYDVSTR